MYCCRLNGTIGEIKSSTPCAGGTAKGLGRTTLGVAGMNALRIPVGRDKYALVDEEDFAYLCRWKWKFHVAGYAVRSGWRNGKFVNVYMHREVIRPPDGAEVDHVNQEKLDNRRANLRPVTRSQNMHNRPGRPNRTSGRRGVSWHKPSGKWWARLQVGGIFHDLGLYDSIDEAGRAYDEARSRLVT